MRKYILSLEYSYGLYQTKGLHSFFKAYFQYKLGGRGRRKAFLIGKVHFLLLLKKLKNFRGSLDFRLLSNLWPHIGFHISSLSNDNAIIHLNKVGICLESIVSTRFLPQRVFLPDQWEK